MRFGVVVVMILGLAGAAAAQERTMPLDGVGTVAAEPDMAVITVGATQQADTAAAAMGAVSKVSAAMLAALQTAGIDAADIRTSRLSLSPVHDRKSYEQGRPTLIGFSASNQVTIRVRALDRVGDVLGELVAVGANDMGGIRFEISDPGPLQDEARRLAVADARARAELFAEAAGVRLGRIMTISEIGSSVPRPEMMRAAAMADAVPVAAGEVAIRAQVQIVWELLD